MKLAVVGVILFSALLAALRPATASAQNAPTPLLEGVDVRIIDGDEQMAPRPVDDATLRYHASRGDKAAVEAEIERLRREHPGWQPPADLMAPAAAAVNEQPLWELYKKADYAGLRAEVTRLQAAHPEWRPPARLLELTEENEVRALLKAKEAAKDWAGVVTTAEAYPRQVACDRIDNMWRLAEARAKLGQPAEALEVYRRIVAGCDDAGHRVATLQKAQAALGAKEVRELFEAEAARPKAPAETARVAALRERPTATPGPPKRTAPPEAAEMRALYKPGATVGTARAAEAVVLARRDAAAARKIGWIRYEAKDHAAAAEWFARAHAWKPVEESARGLALSNAALGDLSAVERLAGSWPSVAGPILESARGEHVARAWERGDHRVVLDQTRGSAPAGLTLLRGWTLMKLERPTEAGLVFEGVVRRGTATDDQREEALYGLARANIAAGDIAEAARIADGYQLALAHRQEVRAELLGRQATQAFERGRYYQALALLEARRGLAAPDRSTQVQEAWANYHIGRPRTAERIFAGLHRVIATEETKEGLRIVRARLNGYEP